MQTTIDITLVTSVPPMNAAEARQAVDQINQGVQFIREKLLELHRRRGFEALGYSTWKQFCEQEFGSDRRRVNYLLAAAVVEAELIEAGVDKGKIFPTPDSHLRAISKAPVGIRKSAFLKLKEWESQGRVTEEDARLAVAAVYPNEQYKLAQELVCRVIESGDSIPQKNCIPHLNKWAEKHGVSLTKRHFEVLGESIEESLRTVAQSILETPVQESSENKSLETASALANFSERELVDGLEKMGQKYLCGVLIHLLSKVAKIQDPAQGRELANECYRAGELLDAQFGFDHQG